MPLVAVASGLWSVTHTMRLPGGVRMPTRMSVARLGDDGLLVHSAIPIDDALAAEIAGLGKVLYVVAPNCFHHLHVGLLLARFPEAKLFGAPGLARKRADLAFTGILGEGSSAPWVETIDQIVLEGAPKLNEVVFFHRASRSLLVTDLFFNITEPENWATGMLLRMVGTYKRFGPSRLWRFYRKDKKALKASVEKVLAWDFVRVLPAHGAVFEADDAREQARARLRWLLA
jgi:glyoxylase-like metal-dependent hydrolase (beta-lactamase superfamily II)